jgi:alpha-D-xyloside xylohydrolase
MNEKLYSKGVDAWWMDATEPDILSNTSIEERKKLIAPVALGSSTSYFNDFAVENAKGVYEGQRRTNALDRVFILTRSAYAGLQKYAAVTWSGDIGARWNDLQNQVAAGMNFSLSGLPYWTTDIGGFSVEKRYENATGSDLDEWRELMTRWYQFGAFCPIFRVHGQYPYREIFNVAPASHPAYKSMLYYDQLRYRLMPYIYSVAGQVYHNDYTMMRPLVMDFAADKAVENIADQYMFGPSFLVNPVYEYKARDRWVYLPANTGWYNFYTGAYQAGGQRINAKAAYERMPLYVKEGSIVPVGPPLQYAGEKPADPITLYVYTGKDAAFTLYEDEGTNYNYEKGLYSNIPVTYKEATKTLTIGQRKGSYPGMLNQRTFNVIWISRTNALSPDRKNNKPAATIQYLGEQVSVTMK